MAVKVFRWKAIAPLLVLLIGLGVLVAIFAEPIARSTTEEAGTELLGTEVDVGKLDLLPRQTSVELGALQVADPFDPRRNLVEAERILVKLNPEALAEKKVVIDNFVLHGMRFGTTRKTAARPATGGGFAAQTLRSVRQWAGRFDVPLLRLTPLDTIKQLVLDPSQLGTVKAAQALASSTDSTRPRAWSMWPAMRPISHVRDMHASHERVLMPRARSRRRSRLKARFLARTNVPGSARLRRADGRDASLRVVVASGCRGCAGRAGKNTFRLS